MLMNATIGFEELMAEELGFCVVAVVFMTAVQVEDCVVLAACLAACTILVEMCFWCEASCRSRMTIWWIQDSISLIMLSSFLDAR